MDVLQVVVADVRLHLAMHDDGVVAALPDVERVEIDGEGGMVDLLDEAHRRGCGIGERLRMRLRQQLDAVAGGDRAYLPQPVDYALPLLTGDGETAAIAGEGADLAGSPAAGEPAELDGLVP
ncbi:hypothetical protein D9M72_553520 [compost metagenome]